MPVRFTSGVFGHGFDLVLAHTCTVPALDSVNLMCTITSIHLLSGIGLMITRSGRSYDQPVQPTPDHFAGPVSKRYDSRSAVSSYVEGVPSATIACGTTLTGFEIRSMLSFLV